eukprot:471406-Amphidinium_carterae.1
MLDDSPLSAEDREVQLNGRLHLGMELEGVLKHGSAELSGFTIKWGLRMGFPAAQANTADCVPSADAATDSNTPAGGSSNAPDQEVALAKPLVTG